MANNTLLASDNFASGSLAAGWSAIFGGSVCQVAGAGPHFTEPGAIGVTVYGQLWTGLTWPSDQISEVTVQALTSSTNNFLQLRVRYSSAADSGYQAVISNGTAKLFVVTAGTPTQLGSTVSGLTIAAGDVWTLEAAGAALILYQNGNTVAYVKDTTYTSGSPGYCQEAITVLTQNEVASWRGYNLVQQDGVWTKQQIVIPAVAADFAGGGFGVALPSLILYEGGAQVLSGTVYKTVFSSNYKNGNGNGTMQYAESLDGKTWSRYPTPILSGYTGGSWFKSGSTYYLYAQANSAIGTGAYSVFTSTDGVTYTLASANVIGVGAGGAWDSSNIWQFAVLAIVGGVWYAQYGATNGTTFGTGLATSPDGLVWTKYSGNPVVSSFGMQQAVYSPDNSTFYVWGAHPNPGQNSPKPTYDPSQGVRYKVTNNFTTWTRDCNSVHNSQLVESVNSNVGGSYVSAITQIGGQVFAYLQIGPDGFVSPIYGIELATVPTSLKALVSFPEDAAQKIATDAFPTPGDLSANWVTPPGLTKLKVASAGIVEATVTSTDCWMLYTATAFQTNQYAEVTIAALPASGSVATPVVRGVTAGITGYYADIEGGANFAFCRIKKVVGGVGTTFAAITTITVQANDVFRLQVFNGSDGFPVLSLFQNGALLLQTQDTTSSPLNSGFPGIYIFASGSLAASQVSLWAGGNANVIPNYPPIVNSGAWVQAFRGFVNKRGVS